MLLEKDPLRLPIRQDHHAAERKDTTSWPSFAQTWPDPKMPLLAGVVFNLRAPDTVRGVVRICRWSTISDPAALSGRVVRLSVLSKSFIENNATTEIHCGNDP